MRLYHAQEATSYRAKDLPPQIKSIEIVDDQWEQGAIAQMIRKARKPLFNDTILRYDTTFQTHCHDLTTFESNGQNKSYILSGCTPNRDEATTNYILQNRLQKLEH